MTITDKTAEMLRLYAERYETEEFLIGDPSWWMHQVKGDANQEAMAFIASALSYGSRSQFMPKIRQLLEWSGGDVCRWISSGEYGGYFGIGDRGCFYRLYNKGMMRSFLDSCRSMMLEYGSIGAYVRSSADDGFSAVESLCRWFSEKGASAVIPCDTKSACKRLCMFLRWMVRSESPVDLGLWSDFIDRKTLIMPLDTHVLSQSMQLGLLSARTASMSAAKRLTGVVSEIFPDDPLRADFALFGVGVNGGNVGSDQ